MTKNKSARKKLRIAERNRLINKHYKTTFKNKFKVVENLVAEGSKEEIMAAFSLAQQSIDKAAKIGAIHPNKADRKKSKLQIKMNALMAKAA
jgi:small subunit ribosomal protein S20